MKHDGCNPSSASGEEDIVPQQGHQDVSCSTSQPASSYSFASDNDETKPAGCSSSSAGAGERFVSQQGHQDASPASSHSVASSSDSPVDLNLGDRDSQVNSHSKAGTDDNSGQQDEQLKKLSSVIIANDPKTSKDSFQDPNTSGSNLQDIETSDDPTDPVTWIPPHAVNGDSFDTFDDDDEDEVDGTQWVKSSFLSCRSFKEEKEKTMKEVKMGRFRTLVSQLLKAIGIVDSEQQEQSWVDIVSTLAWEAALFVKYGATEGKEMDSSSYVKVKCVATGSPSESELIKGMVFKKHAAHKHMPTKCTKPKLLLVQGTLGLSSGLSSLSSMIVQKKDAKDHVSEEVKPLLHHLEVCRPNVVLVEKSAHRDVLEEMVNRGVTLVVDMKRNRLERIARCTAAPILSADSILSRKLKQCDSLYFEKIVEEHAQPGDGGKKPHKTLMFMKGSTTHLGCTVLLKGSHNEELKKIKGVVQRAVVMAHHFILETSFFIDKEVMFSTIVSHGAASQSKEPTVSSTEEKSSDGADCLSSTHDSIVSAQSSLGMRNDDNAQVGIPPSTDASYHITDISSGLHEGGCLSTSEHQDAQVVNSTSTSSGTEAPVPCGSEPDTKSNDEKLSDSQRSSGDGDEHNGRKDNVSAVPDSEGILVLKSGRNALKGTVCEQSRFVHFQFYGNFDVPLGRFLRENMLNQTVSCPACGEPPEAHFYYYAHQNKQLTIRVKRISDVSLCGKSGGKLWMWSRCGKCKPEKEGNMKTTKRVLVSSDARGLSFGKFLELSFSNHSTFHRPSNCGHSLHRDFLHFFGLDSMVSMFRYSPVDVYSIYVPPLKLVFDSSIEGEWLREETQNVYTRGMLLFAEISGYLKKVETRSSGLVNASTKAFPDIEVMLAVEKSEFEDNIKNNCIENGQSSHKLLCLNSIRWELLTLACIWNRRFNLLVPSEKPNATDQDIAAKSPALDADVHMDTIQISTQDAKDPIDKIAIQTIMDSDISSLSLDCSTPSSPPNVKDPKDKTAIDQLSKFENSRGQWVWNPFSEIRKECMRVIHNKAQPPRFLHSLLFDRVHSSDCLPTISQMISEESSKMHIPLCIGDFILSDHEHEISSVIACALASMKDTPQHTEKFSKDDIGAQSDKAMPIRTDESINLPRAISEPYPLFSLPNPAASLASLGAAHPEVSLGTEAHLGKPKYSVVCLYAKEFRNLRNLCYPSELDYIISLSRCKMWDAKGGKSKSVFAKTLDERLIVKEVQKTEYDSFMRFAPQYFEHMAGSFNSGNQTCLGKILGIYQVTLRPKNGKETVHDLMVMENLSFGRKICRQYDLKGTLFARLTANAGGSSEDVLLDQNFVNDMNLSPLYVGHKSKRVLLRAIWNDTSFLKKINVMDYSLLVGVDKDRKELVCGIIDYLREYTWDKHLETWVKTSLKHHQPTVISPKEYKQRFRKFMDTHFLTLPDQ